MKFIQLVKTDLRMMKWVSLIALAIVVAGVIISTLLDSFGFGMMIIASTFIFLPVVYLLMSLSKEWKTGLFVMMPQSGRTLIAAKLAAMILVFSGLALVVLAGFGWTNLLPGGMSFFHSKESIVGLIQLVPFGLHFCLMGGLLGVLAFLATRLADNMLRSWSGLIGFLTSVVVIYLFTGFPTTTPYSLIFHSAVFPSLPLEGSGDTDIGENLSLTIGTEGIFYTGDVFYTVLLLCIMYFGSSWILDKKVQL